MRVALIGDIHANLPALEMVLSHAARHGAEAYWNLGDMLGYGPFPNEVIARLKRENVLSVIGNYDLKVLKFEKFKEKWKETKRPEKYTAFEWASSNLSDESRAFLESLPTELRIEHEGYRILLTHGSPESIKEPLTPSTPESRLSHLARSAGADIIVVGHSHDAFYRITEGIRFINTGSVGRPKDGDPRASYAMADIAGDTIEVEHYRVTYDVRRTITAIRERNLPEVFAHMLLIGQDMDEIPLYETKTGTGCWPDIEPNDNIKLKSVYMLARSCNYEVDHTHHVTRLALRLFDELADLHTFGDKERFMLQCASLLHDIGWIKGQKGHHKTALRIIGRSPVLKLTHHERNIVGLVARYHRRALPSEEHELFGTLNETDKHTVSVLASILRVADGLDKTHRSLVEAFMCRITSRKVKLRCAVRWPAEMERQRALDKGELFEKIFDRHLDIEWYLV